MTALAIAQPQPERIARDALNDALKAMRMCNSVPAKLAIIERAAREIELLGDEIEDDAIDALSDVAIDAHDLDPDAVQAALARGVAAAWEAEYQAGPPNAPPAPTPRGVPESTWEAADYVRRLGDAAALKQWLDRHAEYACEILERWNNG